MGGLAAGLGGLGILGALAGSQGTTQNQGTVKTPGGAPSNYQYGISTSNGALGDYQNYLNAGPGMSAITNANSSASSLAAMLQGYSQGGFMPTQQQMSQAQSTTQQLFAPQQTALNQQFVQQNRQGAQNAALMGRGPNDPVLNNLLMQQQNNMQSSLNSQMGSYSTNMAMQMPQQQLSYANQLNTLNQGLASQALQNRQTLFSMGQNLQTGGQNYMTGNASSQTTQNQPGGLLGGLTGALGMVGAGAGLANLFGGAGAAAGAAGTSLGAGGVASTLGSGLMMA